ncbi:glycosyltransferase [Nocardioides sp. GCM10027113]|uniref:glycosyltransferase n=1 Tax=unclassified Nocardioides TaxID=2615069 RepID=UPI00360EEC92
MDTSNSDVAAIMAVYDQVDPDHLDQALGGLCDQTLRPKEVIVAEDGALTRQLYDVLEKYASPMLPLRRIALPAKSGSGPARQAALMSTDCALVAIADADDISLSRRFARQREALEAGSFDVVGAAMLEFSDCWPGESIRLLPETHDQILRRAAFNNPVNHPTMFIRRQAAVAVGGYRDLPFLEDYDLVARMLAAGARAHNLAEPLVRFRVGDLTLDRRSSRAARRAELALQRNLHSYGLVTRRRMVANLAVRNGYRKLPRPMQRWAHQRLLSSPLPEGATK